jgi:6-phosphogluconolactonase (cycloisomerase 2 family)
MTRSVRVAALVAMTVALGCPPAPGAEVDWGMPGEMVVAPGGAHLYGSSLSLRLDPSGPPTVFASREPSGSEAAMSPDGAFLYTASGNPSASKLHILARDPASGYLTHLATTSGGPDLGTSLGMITDIEVAPDGRQVYVAQVGPSAIKVLARDPFTGLLHSTGTIYASEFGNREATNDLEISPDGRYVYSTGPDLVSFAREPVTGRLSYLGYHGAWGYELDLTPDGRRLFTGGTTVSMLDVDPDTGALTPRGSASPPPGPSDGHGRNVVAAPDGASAYSVERGDPSGLPGAQESSRVAQWRVVAPDKLEYVRSYDIGHVLQLHLAVAGQTLYVSHDQGLTAMTRDTATGDLTTAWTFHSRVQRPHLTPLPPPPTVTINDGALFTNDPNVKLTIAPAYRAASFRAMNDPGLPEPSPIRRIDDTGVYDWRLADGLPGRAVRRVYVQFTSVDWEPMPVVSDDIVLDQRPPEVIDPELVPLPGHTVLRLRARDNRSGVRRLQATSSKANPGKKLPFTRQLRLKGKPRKVFVRVLDGAGNWSLWRAARRP